jgi:hypothetical protein
MPNPIPDKQNTPQQLARLATRRNLNWRTQFVVATPLVLPGLLTIPGVGILAGCRLGVAISELGAGALPYRKKDYLLTAVERAFYEVLVKGGRTLRKNGTTTLHSKKRGDPDPTANSADRMSLPSVGSSGQPGWPCLGYRLSQARIANKTPYGRIIQRLG